MINKEKSAIFFLKDIKIEDIQESIKSNKLDYDSSRILNYSDYYGNRKSQIKTIRESKASMFVLGIYDIDYLKWSYIFFTMVFLSPAKQKLIIDTKGKKQKINFAIWIKESFLAMCSFFVQVFAVVPCLYYIASYKNKKDLSGNLRNYKEKKIAYLRTTDTYNLQSGGSLGHTLGIISGFQKLSKSVSFFAIDEIKLLKSIDNKLIVKPNSFINKVLVFNRFVYCLRFVKRIKEEVKNHDVIYQRISKDDISGLILSKKLNKPLIVEFNSFLSWELKTNEKLFKNLFSKITQKLEENILNNADLIVTVSSVLKDQLTEAGIEESKICVAYNGVDIDKFKPIKETNDLMLEKLQIPSDAKVMGFCGTFGGWHGIPELTEAIKELMLIRSDFYAVLIGDGLLRSKMESELKNFSNIIFTNKVPHQEVIEYLSICDILLSPHSSTNKELFIGSPTKLFEYMALEKIVIGTDLEQISEVLSPSINYKDIVENVEIKDKGQVGVKVKEGNVEQLVKAMDFALTNINNLSFVKENSREKVVENYTWDKTVEKIVGHYGKV